MKQDIHPDWNHQATVTCACGNTFKTGSTKDKIEVDICAKCHPFFTGEMRFVDRQGRVDKFKKKMAAAKASQKKAADKKGKHTKTEKEEQKSYKQLLREQKTALREASKEEAEE